MDPCAPEFESWQAHICELFVERIFDHRNLSSSLGIYMFLEFIFERLFFTWRTCVRILLNVHCEFPFEFLVSLSFHIYSIISFNFQKS